MNRIKRELFGTGFMAMLTTEDVAFDIFLNNTALKLGASTSLRSSDKISIGDKSVSTFIYCDPNDPDPKDYPKQLTDKYIILETLGKGKFGEAKLAFRRGDLERCVIKVLNKATDDEMLKYQKSEVKLMRSMERHPCIVQLFEVVEDKSKGTVYLVMEHADRGDMPDERLPEQVRLVEVLLSGLNKLFNNQIGTFIT